MLLKMYSLVVLVHRFFSNEKIFKMPSKVDADGTDLTMGLSENS